MTTIQGFDFFKLTFDQNGAAVDAAELAGLLARANATKVTDVVLIAHGFRNDEADATKLYTNFLTTLRGHLGRPEFATVATRKFAIGGIYWPSKTFKEAGVDDPAPSGTRELRRDQHTLADAKARLQHLKKHDATPAQRKKLDHAIDLLPTLETDPDAQDEFVKDVLSLLDHSPVDATEGLPQIKKQSGSEILAKLDTPGATGTRGIGDVVGAIGGRVGQFLNLTTWYVMKDRSGTVGEKGVAEVIHELHSKQPAMKIHLVGHSLGGRLMASCARTLASAPVVHPDSLTLLEAAFSHFGFSPDNGHGKAGFFRDVVAKQVVKTLFLSTFSGQDTDVGHAYSIMSRLAGDNTREIGDANDEFGGIGRNGPLKTAEVSTTPLHAPGTPYAFKPAVINNLDGSGGLIKDHGDVTNAAVTYAFASAMART